MHHVLSKIDSKHIMCILLHVCVRVGVYIYIYISKNNLRKRVVKLVK